MHRRENYTKNSSFSRPQSTVGQRFAEWYAVWPFGLTRLDQDPYLDRIYWLPITCKNEDHDLRFSHLDIESFDREQLRRELRLVNLRLHLQPPGRPWVIYWLKERGVRLEEALREAS